MFPQNTRFLVVDDMPTMRSMVREQLRSMGYKNIQEVDNGEDALKLLLRGKQDGYQVEVVICDWNMPKMSGLELLKQVRSLDGWGKLPFILLTSESEREQVTEAVLAGVSQYIVKPFTNTIFSEKLEGVWKKVAS